MGLSEWVETAVDSTTSRMEGVREIGEETVGDSRENGEFNGHGESLLVSGGFGQRG